MCSGAHFKDHWSTVIEMKNTSLVAKYLVTLLEK